MSKEELTHYGGLLYDVCEPPSLSAIPVDQVAESLKLLNPALEAKMAADIAVDHDSKGKQTLTREDFALAVVFSLQTTDMGDAIQIVRDLTVRMRVAFRRRYLMYDAPASTPPPALLENAKAVSMYRDLWDFMASGSDTMTRPQLRKLAQCILEDHPAEASNVVKAAIGDRETDTISFLEFLMVMQQASQVVPLSDMIIRARRKFDKDRDMQIAAERKIVNMVNSAGFASDRAATITAQLKENSRLQQEVNTYAMSENIATERARSMLWSGTSAQSSSILDEPVPAIPAPLSPPRAAVDAALERELAKLRTENERLTHALAIQGGKATDKGENQQTLAAVKAQREREAALQKQVTDLEQELKQARAHIAISTEAADLGALLRAPGANKTSVLKEHFIEESTLLGKHKYLRDVAQRFEDPNSPVSLLINQYELLISGYQALYRDLKGRWEYAKTKRFNPMEAAKNIVSQAQNTPSSSRPLTPSSPVQVNSAVFSWAEIDCAPSEQLRHTGLPGDPLLTDAERHQLRAKLAAQMRSTARHYTPTNSSQQNRSGGGGGGGASRSTPRMHTPSQVSWSPHHDSSMMSDPNSDSIDAIRQLQSMTPAARRY